MHAILTVTNDDDSRERFSPGEEMLPGLLAWEPLGGGTRCETWLAWSTELWAPVAVKLPLENLLGRPESASGLAREAATLAALRHPAIERLLEDRHHDTVPHLVKEYVEGPTLAQMLEDEGALAPADAIRLAMQIASGLHHMHGRGVVHLDLKPHNVVLRDGRAVILDLDLAKPIGTAVPRWQRRPEGSVPWMAPEQCRMRPANPQMDIFALGALLYEVCTGVRPFTASARTYPQLTARPRPPRELRPRIPPALDRVITTLMTPDPGGRPRCATEVLALLRSALPAGEDGLWPEWAGALLAAGAS